MQLPVDPAANFAAHQGRHGIVVDRMNDGNTAVLVSKGGFLSDGSPFVVEERDRDVAALWRNGTDLVVRTSAANDSPTLGDVSATFDGDALRLTFRPAAGAIYRTSAFHHVEGGAWPAMIGQPATSVVDIPGMYFAEIRNGEGASVGWIRVAVGSFGAPRRVYSASLPAGINGPLAVAAVKRIDSELNRMERHAYNPYVAN